MPVVAKTGTPSLSSDTPPQSSQIVGLLAGEDIAAGDACRINAADGRVYRSSGAAAGVNAKVRGFAAKPAKQGEAVTLYAEVNFRYGAGLARGGDLYVSGTVAGGLDDAPSLGGTAPVGYVIDDTRIRVWSSRY